MAEKGVKQYCTGVLQKAQTFRRQQSSQKMPIVRRQLLFIEEAMKGQAKWAKVA